MEEIWKDIKGFEGYYQISSYGRVKRLPKKVLQSNGSFATYRERILKQENLKGYLRVTLSLDNKQKRFYTHRLVAQHFIQNSNSKKYVNHIDGNKENNKISNLEWCTASENERHSYDVLGKINNNRKLKEADVLDILNNCEKGINKTKRGNVIHFMNKYNVCRSTIINVLNKKYYV